MELTEEVPVADAKPAPVASDLQPDIDTVHLARFEFNEKGGTKVLMVEWLPGADHTHSSDIQAPSHTSESNRESKTIATSDTDIVKGHAGWEVSWPGKSTFLPARDVNQDGAKRRVYFLLPHEAAVPANISITRTGSPSITLKPLPAIFPEGFDVEAGNCGVLHTLWAKKRLSELDREIKAEMKTNAEGIGLQMVIAERDWISDTFLPPPPSTVPPMSPRSPIGGRLGEKLKGLRLGTTAEDLIPSPTANTFTGTDVPSKTLSPVGDDIAIPSFPTMSNPAARPTATASLDAIANSDLPPNRPASQDNEDDLFALPMSPRSPEMKRSPFSAL